MKNKTNYLVLYARRFQSFHSQTTKDSVAPLILFSFARLRYFFANSSTFGNVRTKKKSFEWAKRAR